MKTKDFVTIFAPDQITRNETIVLVPFFRAKTSEVKKHVQFLNELGFAVNVVHLSQEPGSLWEIPISSDFKLGLAPIWTDQVEQAFNQQPGEKIVFAMSNTSVAAIGAIGRRQAVDIKALICDSGPVARLWPAVWNLYTYAYPIKSYIARLATAALGSVVWSPRYAHDLQESLKKFPQDFPILSIRGWKDKLNSPEQIDAVFEPHSHLRWQKLAFPESDHLKSLKDHPDEYKKVVKQFLWTHSSPKA